MRLCDIDREVERVPVPRGAPAREAAAARWRPFFVDYLRPDDATADAYARRPFADGGYLDNKPFGYATDALLWRRAEVPVRRKLLYVEPAPESLGAEDRADGDAPVDALQNVEAAVLSLPRYETIREDLQRVLARNRLVARVAHFTTGVEEDLYTRYSEAVDEPPDRDDWEELDLRDRITRKGVSYGGYHRLKVSTLTGELAAALMKAAGFGPGTDYLLAFQLLLRAWREGEYVRYRPAGPGPKLKTENRFLVEFDVNYRLRRLTFVRDKLDRLWSLSPEALAVLRNLLPVYRAWGDEAPGADADRAEWGRVRGAVAAGRWPWPGDAGKEAFRRELRDLRTQLAAPLDRLYRLERILLGGTRGAGDMEESDAELVTLVRATGLTARDLETLLAPGSEDTCLSRARNLLDRQRDAFQAISVRLRKLVADVTIAASEECRRTLRAPAADLPARLARLCVRAYYDYYEDFDLVLFPLLHPSPVGELAEVDVIRVSPVDAERAALAPKLAGTALMNFAAFLRRAWRVNDVLWGRLDGAQRLISTLLPDPADNSQRQALIDDAHRIILAEDLRPQDRDELYRLFVDALVRVGPGDLTTSDVGAAVREFRESISADSHGKILRLLLDEAGLLDYMRRAYEVDRRRDAVTELRLIARAVQVTGRVAEGIARKHLPANPRVAWLARAGLIFWGLVEVLIPDSFFRLVTTHFFKLLYLFAVLLLAGGLLFGATAVWRLGLSVLLVTAVVHGTVVWVGDALTGRRPSAGAARDLAVWGGVALAAYGGMHLLEELFSNPTLGLAAGLRSRDAELVIAGAGVTGVVLLAATAGRKFFGRGA